MIAEVITFFSNKNLPLNKNPTELVGVKQTGSKKSFAKENFRSINSLANSGKSISDTFLRDGANSYLLTRTSGISLWEIPGSEFIFKDQRQHNIIKLIFISNITLFS